MKKLLFVFCLIPTIAFANVCYQNQSGGQLVDVNDNATVDNSWVETNCAVPTPIDPSAQQTAQLIAQDEQALAIADLQNQGIINSDQATTASANLTALTAAKTTAVATPKTSGTQTNGT